MATGVIVMLVGEVVNEVTILVSLAATRAPSPQAELKATLTLSPVVAAVFVLNLTLITCEFIVPESITAIVVSINPLPLNGPTNDQDHPVAEAVVEVAVVAAGKAGAE